MATLFEKITESKETLAEYLLKACDNPVCERNEDMCDFCELSDISNDCTEERCLNAIVKALDSQVNWFINNLNWYRLCVKSIVFFYVLCEKNKKRLENKWVSSKYLLTFFDFSVRVQMQDERNTKRELVSVCCLQLNL